MLRGVCNMALGDTWISASNITQSVSNHYSDNYGFYLATSDGKIIKTIDGSNYTLIEPSKLVSYRSYFVLSAGAIYVGYDSYNKGIQYSSDNTSWYSTNKTTGHIQCMFVKFQNAIYVGIQNAGIWKSTNGTTWTQTGKTNGNFTSIATNENDTLLMATEANGTGIWKSSDGNTWTQMSLTGQTSGIAYIGDGAFACVFDTSGGIRVCLDGITWQVTNITTGTGNSRICATPNGSVALASLSDGIYTTSNKTTWNKISEQIFGSRFGINPDGTYAWGSRGSSPFFYYSGFIVPPPIQNSKISMII